MRKFSLILLSLLSVSLCGCSWFGKRTSHGEGEAVARVYDYILLEEDLTGIVPQGASRQDSIAITSNFIENWIRQKVVLHKAERNLDEEKKNVEKKLEEYRNSLVTYAYETELIRQKLDTVVSDTEIQDYYEKNKNNFELKDNIIRVIYLKLKKNSPKLNKAKEWYKSSIPKDRNLLHEYCVQYAENYFLDDATWLMFDDLLKEIPIKTYDKEQFLQNNRNIEIEDSSSIYLVSIKGFMIKKSTSPLSFERNNIRNLIINQRKLALLEKMEQQAYDEAKNEGALEIY
ncbi:MAG: hypothetical protein DWQ44_08325 [Bacteroidetes bacterium]|nr:MAG: hypothetical protein DWQ33_01725 [Bacteroidota bacterium]REK07015.1 MAG: hypothetical protein DWQ39_02365 [Bacteroidota bacterium]REK33638.1 MAG: hypothetical protein DWQ44_08325 [Bacteroidota bacterium]REK48624.1 MAG: hypothetical protein DWQ48_09765 [Bacteroidota bacterium]